MKNTFISLFFSVCFITISAQNSENYWSAIKEKSVSQSGARQIVPIKYLTFSLNTNAFIDDLRKAPNEKLQSINASPSIVELPTPGGQMQRFRVVEAPVMAEALQNAFPDIRSYSLKGIDDPYANGKLDFNAFGVHAMVRSPNGDFFIDPYCLRNTRDYIIYFTSDFVKEASQMLPEIGVLRENESDQNDKKRPTYPAQTSQRPAPAAPCAGGILKTYRLAVACTGEYAIAATGSTTPTLAQTLAKVVTTVNRVDGVYETDLSIRLSLVPSTTLVLYTNPATDSFTGSANSNQNTLINLSQTIITASVGAANFDIGHTFSTGGGGLANLGCVCINSQKARGITGSANPVGDPYDIDYVAHEMGHQFGGNHTFNAVTGNCSGNREPSCSVEPGSGVTVMAYAGICGSNNLASNSIPYFHGFSYDEIINYTSFSTGAACAVSSTTGNQPPVVSIGSSTYAVPMSTPFYLTGSATDPDGDPLTYSWEEMDPGPTAGNWNSGTAPFFRSYAPVVSPTRFFPRANVVISGNYTNTIGEFLPNSAQTLDFRLTVRDNKMGGGGVCYAKTQVIVDSLGPFELVYPSAAGVNWVINTPRTVLWDPGFTNQLPVACDSVRMLISYNSGATYSVIVNSMPNFGWYTITAPNLSVTNNNCRIKVESIGNIFYDISNNDFTISTDPNVGLNEINQEEALVLTVYPNPSTGVFYVRTSNLQYTSATTLCVKDLIGRVLFQKVYAQPIINDQIDMSSFDSGIYFISVNCAGAQKSQRIVKQ